MKTDSQISLNQHRIRLLGWLIGLLALIFILSIFLGRYPHAGLISPKFLGSNELAQRLVFDLRLPRILTALLLGAALAAAGNVMQMIFNNPLVEPGFLGVSQGASFGAAFSIIFLSKSTWAVQISATVFAFVGLGLSYFIAQRVHYGGWVLRLVLAGIAVSAFFSSGVGILKYVADPMSQLPEITFWLLGGLWALDWGQLISILPAVSVGLLIIYLMRWRINLLSLSDETAFSLGSTPGRERMLLLTAAVLVTAAVISVAGMVGWVGLIIPHIARRIFGADSRFTMPASMLIGAGFTLICDDLARTVFAGELPLGILTSLIGAAVFLVLMVQRKGAAE